MFLLDLLTVSETAHDVTFDEGNGINSPTNLGLEATFINQNFSQQCLKRGPEKKVFPNPNPFVTDEDEGQVASVAYRYGDKKTVNMYVFVYISTTSDKTFETILIDLQF